MPLSKPLHLAKSFGRPCRRTHVGIPNAVTGMENRARTPSDARTEAKNNRRYVEHATRAKLRLSFLTVSAVRGGSAALLQLIRANVSESHAGTQAQGSHMCQDGKSNSGVSI